METATSKSRALVAPPGEQVLLVSPPVGPPWLSGTTVLARDLATGGREFRYRLLGRRGRPGLGGAVVVEPLYRSPKGSSLTDRLRVAGRLMRPDRCRVHHFLFTPSKRTATIARVALTISRKASVQTVPSQPGEGVRLAEVCFADRVVAVSEATAILLRSAGVQNVSVIRPSVPLPAEPADRERCRRRIALSFTAERWGDAPTFLYPGDLEFSDGARTFVEAAALVTERVPEARFVLACRPKTPASGAVLAELRARVERLGLAEKTSFLGVVPDMSALLGAVDVVVLPVDTLFAKLDIPMVLLEAMAAGRPVVVSDLPPLMELAGIGEGAAVVPRSRPEALAEKLSALAASPERAASLGRAARQTAALHFDPETMIAAYEDLYREVSTRG